MHLLLASPRANHQGVLERNPLLEDDAGKLQQCGGAAAVIVGTRGRVCARGAGTAAGVVVRSYNHNHVRLRVALEGGDYVGVVQSYTAMGGGTSTLGGMGVCRRLPT